MDGRLGNGVMGHTGDIKVILLIAGRKIWSCFIFGFMDGRRGNGVTGCTGDGHGTIY